MFLTILREGSLVRTRHYQNNRTLLLLLLIFFPALACFPQWIPNEHYSIRQFTDDDGLPQNSVKSMGPDQNGFVWLATEFGLVRFDGQRFHNYRKDTGSVLDSRVIYILPSGKPFQYIALTGGKQLNRADATTARLPPELAHTNIYLRGHVFKETVYTTIGLPNIYYTGSPAPYYCLPLDTARYFLVSKDSIHYKGNNGNEYAIRYPVKNPLHCFIADRQLYYLPPGDHPVLLQQSGAQTVRFTGQLLQDPAFMTARDQLRIYWNVLVNQVFVYIKGALYLVQKDVAGNLHTTLVLSGFDCEANKIMCVYHDRASGRTLLGSQTTGLFVAKKNDFTTTGIRTGIAGDNNFYAHVPYQDSSVATPQGYILNASGFEKKIPALQGTTTTDKYSMLVAADKTMWVKNERILMQLNASGTTVLQKFSFPQPVTQIFEDSSHRIWIGVYHTGIYSISPGMTAPTRLFTGKWDVTFLQQQNADCFWMGTSDGCYRIYLSAKKIDTLPAMKGKYVRSIYVRGLDEIWLTTYEEGFFLYTRNKLVRFPIDQNKFLLTAHCILEDEKGFFWITTNKGLFQVARVDLLRYAQQQQPDVYYYYYEKSDGFRTNEFNGGCQPCGIKLSRGRFSFPSLNGLVSFQPDSIQPELPNKPLFIHNVELDGIPVPISDTLKLRHNMQQLRFFVSTPYSGHPYNLHIEYTLLQHDDDTVWLPLGEDQIITLGSIPSGTHRLLIRKQTGFGAHQYTYKMMTLQAPPFFYQSAWFIAAVVLALVLLAWFLSAIRTQYIRRKNHELEERIHRRTRELENTMLALQDSEYHLRRQASLQKRLITAMAHDIKTPLKFMAESAHRMARRLEQQGSHLNHEEALVLFESGTQVYHYTENLLHYIKSQTGQQHISLKPEPVFQLVQQKVDLFQHIAVRQSCEIVNEVPAHLVFPTNAGLLGVILHNLLDNAVKITINGQVRITAVMEGSICILAVEDTGAGMRPALVEWCNRSLATGTGHGESDRLPGHNGMGLLIVKELAPLINARLHVTTGAVRGTAVQLFIHLSQEEDVYYT